MKDPPTKLLNLLVKDDEATTKENKKQSHFKLSPRNMGARSRTSSLGSDRSRASQRTKIFAVRAFKNKKRELPSGAELIGRWRRATRILLVFIRWMRIKNIGQHKGFMIRRIIGGVLQERSFNVQEFSTNIEQHQILSHVVKYRLFKPPKERTETDILNIVGYFNRLLCFERYTANTKRRLASTVTYNCFHTETRVLYKEGQLPKYFYMILSGEVQEYCNKQADESDGTDVHGAELPVGAHFKTGDHFGEVGLLEGKPRRTTAKTIDMAEVFTLPRADFINILKEFQIKEADNKLQTIRSLKMTRGVSDADMEWAVEMSFIRNFAKGEIVIRGMECMLTRRTTSRLFQEQIETGHEFYGMIVMKGSVVLEKKITIHQDSLPCGEKVYRVPTKSEADAVIATVTQKVRERAENLGEIRPLEYRSPSPIVPPKTRYIAVTTYHKGDFFCPKVMECDYLVGACEPTQLLYIPRSPFMAHRQCDEFVRMFEEMAMSPIPVDDMLREYNMSNVWKDYKTQLVQQVLTNKQNRKQIAEFWKR